MCACAHLLQSFLTLCDPVHCSPPNSSVHGILQARILEWVALPSSKALGDLPVLGIQPVFLMSSALASEFFTTSATWEAPYSLITTKPKPNNKNQASQFKNGHKGFSIYIYPKKIYK